MVLNYSKEKGKRLRRDSNEASSSIYKLLDRNPTIGIVYHCKVGEMGIRRQQGYEFVCGRKWQKQGPTLSEFL